MLLIISVHLESK